MAYRRLGALTAHLNPLPTAVTVAADAASELALNGGPVRNPSFSSPHPTCRCWLPAPRCRAARAAPLPVLPPHTAHPSYTRPRSAAPPARLRCPLTRATCRRAQKAVGEVDESLFKWPIVTEEDEEAVLDALRNHNLSGTNITREFEKDFASWLGTEHALAYPNGPRPPHPTPPQPASYLIRPPAQHFPACLAPPPPPHPSAAQTRAHCCRPSSSPPRRAQARWRSSPRSTRRASGVATRSSARP